MSDEIHMPWLARSITVLKSSDPTLVGLSGTILNETRRTIHVQTGEGEVRLAKNVITFTIDSGDAIDGSTVTQRPEDRINRRYRRD